MFNSEVTERNSCFIYLNFSMKQNVNDFRLSPTVQYVHFDGLCTVSTSGCTKMSNSFSGFSALINSPQSTDPIENIWPLGLTCHAVYRFQNLGSDYKLTLYYIVQCWLSNQFSFKTINWIDYVYYHFIFLKYGQW
jgi:hypothetical protein